MAVIGQKWQKNAAHKAFWKRGGAELLGLDGANKNDPGPVRERSSKSGLDVGLVIRRMLRAQFLTGLIMAGILFVVSGPVSAYSSVFGSLAAYIPAMIFAALATTKIGNDSAVFLRAAVIGEAAKLLVTALICMAVFLWVEPLAPGWFFGGMIIVIFSGYFSLLRGVDF